MTGPALVHDLATAINGEVRANSLIITRDGDTVHVIDCTPTGRVMLNGRYQLGNISDGTVHLAAMYHAATAEVPC